MLHHLPDHLAHPDPQEKLEATVNLDHQARLAKSKKVRHRQAHPVHLDPLANLEDPDNLEDL